MNIRRTFPLIAIAAVAIIAAMLAGPTQPSAQGPSWDTVTDSVLPVSNPTQPSTGPGYKPPAPTNQTCNCKDCLTEADVRKIVVSELTARGYGSARPTTTNGSNGSTGGSGTVAPVVAYQTPPPVQYQSAPVYYQSQQPVTYQTQQPRTTTVRTGLFGRRIQTYSTPQAPQSCRMVNGQVVCQ